MKQIQWATANIGEDGLRETVESLLNQEEPWELESWKVIGQGVNADNQPVVTIAVCMVREKAETPKVGRPKKDA